MKKPFVWIALGLVLTTAGCALPPPAPTYHPEKKELAQLKAGQSRLSGEVTRLRNDLLLLEARLQDQQKGIAELRRTLVAQKVTSSGEKAAKEPSAAAAAQTGAKNKKAPPPAKIYLKAFADYASGRYLEAIAGFGSFLQVYPDNDFADSAQYWLGECFYSLQQYPRAVEEFDKAVKNYPKGNKTPDALLQMAAALRKMNQPERAAEALRLLQKQYPDSQAARKAREAAAPEKGGNKALPEGN